VYWNPGYLDRIVLEEEPPLCPECGETQEECECEEEE